MSETAMNRIAILHQRNNYFISPTKRWRAGELAALAMSCSHQIRIAEIQQIVVVWITGFVSFGRSFVQRRHRYYLRAYGKVHSHLTHRTTDEKYVKANVKQYTF